MNLEMQKTERELRDELSSKLCVILLMVWGFFSLNLAFCSMLAVKYISFRNTFFKCLLLMRIYMYSVLL